MRGQAEYFNSHDSYFTHQTLHAHHQLYGLHYSSVGFQIEFFFCQRVDSFFLTESVRAAFLLLFYEKYLTSLTLARRHN